MNKVQGIVLLVGLAMLAILYFLPIKPPKMGEVERSRQLNMEVSDEWTLLKEARERQNPSTLLDVDAEMDRLASIETDSQRIPHLEKLSGLWYGQFNEPLMAGVYAEKIANIEPTAQRWETAGITFLMGLGRYGRGKEREHCFKHAVQALENAISLNPDEVNYRVNLAVCYAEAPPANNPMKGIQMLMSLREQNPNHVGVLNQLGRFAIQTGQIDKALERLNHAHSIAPNNQSTISLLVQGYKLKGDLAKAAKYEALLK